MKPASPAVVRLDEVWADFRVAIGNRRISDALGELVEREVARY